MGDGLVMTSQEYLAELERRLDHDDPEGAYTLWCEKRDQRLDLGLSADERRRLRGTLHIVLQMAADLRWDRGTTMDQGSRQRMG
jgi:hypothetical protein